MDEANVAVGHHGLDFEVAVGRNDDEERLGTRYHPAHRVHGELLHRAIHRCCKCLELSASFGLDDILP
jgi:hypothetical protein